MKKKVIALIIAIPLILMFSIFSVTNVASLAIEISVSEVVITVEGRQMAGEIFYFDIAQASTLKVTAHVIPLKATSQKVTYYLKEIEGKNANGITIDTNSGVISAERTGSVLVVARSLDGGREDFFIFVAWSSLALDIAIEGAFMDNVRQNLISQNDKFVMKATFQPDSDVSDRTIRWQSSDTNIIEIDKYSGEARANSAGSATITASINGLGGVISDSIELEVQPISSPSGIVTSGGQNAVLYTVSSQIEWNVWLNYEEIQQSLTDFDMDNPFVFEYIYPIQVERLDGYKYKMTTQIGEEIANIKVRINDCFYDFETQSKYSTITVNRLQNEDFEYDILLDNYYLLNSTKIAPIQISPTVEGDIIKTLGLTFEVSVNNACVRVNRAGEEAGLPSFAVKAEKIGSSVITLKVYANNRLVKSIAKNIEVIAPYAHLEFAESKKWGVLDIFTLGRESLVDNAYMVKGHKLDLRGRLSGSPSGNVVEDLDNITFVVSDSEIATIANGRLIINSEGIVTITAKSGSASAVLTVKCVEGVNVYNYEELVLATEDKKAVVIQDNIYLGRQLFRYSRDAKGKIIGIESLLNSGESLKDILLSEVKSIDITADDTYYKNLNIPTPKLKYCIEFANNVYGNGYIINGQNITYMLDATDTLRQAAVFRGPLNMVAMEGAAVKGQDNIVFLARDNVVIDNVELKGCEDVDDLTKLNYVGTTLEVMGDNVVISNSRINNGRTVIRVFGDSDADKLINVKIASCIIANAREFLIKIGTNKFVLGKQSGTIPDFEGCSPKLANYNYLDKQKNLNDANFVRDYVKTKVNVRDCVIYNSGLFAIGIESKFAGPCLDGYSYLNQNFAELGWKNIAGTSYASILELSGDVRIYDWKNINYIDSSTLIEGDTIKFDIKSLISYLETSSPNIFVKEGLDYYAHGGIALYGGGKNYSIVDMSAFEGVELKLHTVGFEDLGEGWESKILPYAAGKSPFQFLMYDNTTDSLTYLRQREDMHSGAWLNWMPVYNGGK